MSVRQGSEKLVTVFGSRRLKALALWLGLAFMLAAVGCAGPRNSLRPMDRGCHLAGADDQEDSFAGELSAQHIQELYAKSGLTDRDHSLEKEMQKWSHQSKIDFPIQMNKQVRAYIIYFATERKRFTARALARSRRYLPMIKAVFREYGLPADLAYLAMVESGFNPKAHSPAGAAGMWQFIRGTGRRYGLVINRHVDQRLNPKKSTRAAAKYLLDLYKKFGSWYLAAASYNCGENRVAKELRKSNYRNFWQLSANKCIPGETRNYVPQMIAATIIARNPQKFGFGTAPYHPPTRPSRAPNIALAQVIPPAPASSHPRRRIRPPKVHLASRSGPQPHAREFASQHPPRRTQKPPQPVNRRIYAADHRNHRQPTTSVRSTPYMASLLGYPHSSSRKTTLSRKKSSSSHRTRRWARSRKTKSSPTLLARKYKSKPAHLAKKKTRRKAKFYRARRRSRHKALLVSEVR